MLNLRKSNATLTKDQIVNYYCQSCKKKSEFRVGLEYERVSINSKSFKSAAYDDLRQIITHFAIIKGWELLKDGCLVIGATEGKSANSSSISLEPGGQFEISLEPKKTIGEIEEETGEIVTLLNSIGKIYDTKFLSIGITPFSTYQNIDMVKKNRYEIMSEYLPTVGKFSPVMMRETASVQVNFDYESESDALLKLSTCALVSPFLTGFFANSPIRNNKTTSYKSFRALAWHFTDRTRCGLFYKNLVKWRASLGFEDYVNAILDVPMLFFERGDKKIVIGGEITFNQFLMHGYRGYQAEFADYKLHASLCFPDIRLKNCLEIRNHDSQEIPLALAVCAFYKGILHSEGALLEVQKLLKGLSHQEVQQLGVQAAKHGLHFDAMGKSAFEITQKLFNISKNALEASDQKHLEAPLRMLLNKECVADIALKAGIKNAKELVEFYN
ncbi:gamma-glutamylcysteine synthetase [Candidatus Gastranaerophilus sp. (ex Termes propinquus)]|nr:gamma-glutamylcysteine synthetase [Candidatus Gastranaerophilus sp. (ex Termes propinquus)]